MGITLRTVEDNVEQRISVAAARSVRDHHLRLLHSIFWLVAITLGLVHAWAGRYEMDTDGISYLDMGDAYLRGDWQMAVNAYWSPLYSWLLGAAMRFIKPSPYWEFPVAQLINFLIYVGALFCFTFFVRELIGYQQAREEGVGDGGRKSLPAWAWLVLGYSLFIWSSLELITISRVTPDMCVAACVYLAAGILLRIGRGAGSWATFALLGVVLGVGYLAKAAMFPLAFVFLAASLFAAGNVRRAAARVLVALSCFMLVAGPFIIALSVAKGRVTFGDSGRLNYAWYVSKITYRHWRGGPVGSGTPQHATRKVMESPAVYEFGSPIRGTYPLWYDPSYWNEGMAPRFDLRRHLENMVWRPNLYANIFFSLHGSLALGLFVLLYMSRRGKLLVKDVAASWLLLVPTLAAFAMYMQVYVETRFIGAFVVLLFTGLYSIVRLLESEGSHRLVRCVMIIIVVMFILVVGLSSARMAYAAVRDGIRGEGATAHEQWQVAEGLKRMGVRPGDKVASVKYSNIGNAKWARLARVQIVAEMYSDAYRTDEDDFWMANEAVKAQIIQSFAKAGADIIVANAVPSGISTAGWQRIGDTGYYVYFLS